jgi:peptidyl-prolyl cis-trans isomerase SurA
MNKLFFPVRSALVHTLWAAVGLLSVSTTMAQSTPGMSTPAPVRQADFIVAVVNSEPITNREVQVLRQRLAGEADARGGNKPDAAELTRAAVEQLINEKAQLQQAREVGIKIDAEAITQAELNVASSNQLSREEMLKRLAQEGISESAFREQLRTQLTLTRLREREIEGRVRVSDLEVEQFLVEQLKAQAAQVPPQLNLGMVLIAVPENSNESVVKALGERAAEVARRAQAGENFAELAKAFSQAADQGANGGEMGLRPADRYPELFLDATRNLKAGEVTAPVRSGAGFHILKLLDRRQATTLLVTQTRARHILLRPSAQMSQAQAVAKLNEVRQAVVSGKADFAVLAREMSQDGSAQQGGDLGWASPGMFVPEFEQVMGRLRPGQVAEPLVSRFGVHLIEVTDRRNAPMSDQEQRTLARSALREKKLDEAYATWVEDIRGRAYVEMREPPQ